MERDEKYLADKVLSYGLNVIKSSVANSADTNTRRFRRHFGVSPKVILRIWWKLRPYREASKRKIKLKHVLWAYLLLKVYGPDEVMANIVGVNETTFRLHAWELIFAISDLSVDVIRWENRYKDDIGNDCLTSVDCTDCPVEERDQLPLKKRWYTPKFCSAGYRYEIAICIRTGEIVWINGPFKCGEMNDLMIFREGLKHQLDPNERVEADKTYAPEDPWTTKTPNGFHDEELVPMRSLARSYHENVNGKIKVFKALSTPFRQRAEFEDKHCSSFFAAAVAVQLSIQLGEKTFDLPYDDQNGIGER